jgi:hypothetical protein
MKRVLDLFQGFRNAPHLRFEHVNCLNLGEDEWIYVSEKGTGCGMRHPSNSQCEIEDGTKTPPEGCGGAREGDKGGS